jgi:GntR family transcriptional regulator
MLLKLDESSPAPLYDQIAAEIRRAVARGEVAVSEQLPPARALAEALEVNMHTVLRAYGILRDEGLIELRRGRGAVVRRGVDPERAALTELARSLLDEAERQGVTRAEVLEMIERLP